MNEFSKQHYHFIGIGGIGMGTIASLLLDQGKAVSGSDVKESAMTISLRKKGACVYIGHKTTNLPAAGAVVYSSAIRPDNPELAQARQRGLSVLRRAELLAQLMSEKTAITVAGAHGKTTTTSMISNMLIQAGWNPTTAVGGILTGEYSYHASLGSGAYFVAEVDESDGSFLCFEPHLSVINNIDFEHVDFYHDWETIEETYRKFIQRTRPGGKIFSYGGDGRLQKLIREVGIPNITFGFGDGLYVSARNYRLRDFKAYFDCAVDGQPKGEVCLSVPGEHNILNALGAIAVGLELGIDLDIIRASLADFKGVRRRFELKGCVNGITVVDDYAHHPTEIQATLNATRSLRKKRLITVFQPHRYSRTKYLLDNFIESLAFGHYLVLTDIYAASEEAMEGVHSRILYDQLRLRMKEVHYMDKESVAGYLFEVAQPGDVILTLGAGDIYKVGEVFLGMAKKQESSRCR